MKEKFISMKRNICSWLEHYGRVRAAAVAARYGNHDLAKQIISKEVK